MKLFVRWTGKIKYINNSNIQVSMSDVSNLQKPVQLQDAC